MCLERRPSFFNVLRLFHWARWGAMIIHFVGKENLGMRTALITYHVSTDPGYSASIKAGIAMCA